ncbi:hypothetical protein, partial [Aquamicrobium sp.]|uniref:hypothetical protein n=1 Tax=Aquamicrobium sp. TaxID=1872579 RepID=UPI00258A6C41
MSTIRALTEQDLPVVANMLQQVLRHKNSPAPASLVDYMRSFYLSAPGCGDDITSLVHVTDAGEVSGFIGVHVLPMAWNDRKLRAAICSSFMVAKGNRDPMAGARLMKAFMDGPQDLSFSETANHISTQMWTRLRGITLPQYSLDWIRIIRPCSFAVSMIGQRFSPARLFNPLAFVTDNVWRKRLKPGEARWTATAPTGMAPVALRTREINRAEFAELAEPLTAHFALKPHWPTVALDRILSDAADKPDWGQFVMVSVTTASGASVGAFAYHALKGGIGRVLQIMSRPGQAGAVIDCL